MWIVTSFHTVINYFVCKKNNANGLVDEMIGMSTTHQSWKIIIKDILRGT